jgi:hypothetical protein
VVTKQTYDEGLFIIRVTYDGRAAWHCTLVPFHKKKSLEQLSTGSTINPLDFSRFIQYRNEDNDVCTASGWGDDPPEKLKKWIHENYRKDFLKL